MASVQVSIIGNEEPKGRPSVLNSTSGSYEEQEEEEDDREEQSIMWSIDAQSGAPVQLTLMQAKFA
jgi:hypothetical protein